MDFKSRYILVPIRAGIFLHRHELPAHLSGLFDMWCPCCSVPINLLPALQYRLALTISYGSPLRCRIAGILTFKTS
jgi:hypothetical protein